MIDSKLCPTIKWVGMLKEGRPALANGQGIPKQLDLLKNIDHQSIEGFVTIHSMWVYFVDANIEYY